MKKIVCSLAVFVAVTIAAFGMTGRTIAKDIKTLNAAIKNDTISISGTAEAGTLAVAILVYDEAGSELLAMETASVSDENLYYAEIGLTDGTYLVKVADYDGGDYKTATVSPETEESSEEEATVIPTAPNSGTI
ncbi:hypothetical protein IJ090_02960 [Candidatus Saccharibacteria bacterium]|nr:hypothetical protein [Candidatus Saccharibacteria bacterium]